MTNVVPLEKTKYVVCPYVERRQYGRHHGGSHRRDGAKLHLELLNHIIHLHFTHICVERVCLQIEIHNIH